MSYYYEEEEPDVHELQKMEIFGSTSERCDKHFEKSRPCPEKIYGVSDQHAVLDTYSAVYPTNSMRGTYKFDFMVQGVTGDQHIGTSDTVDNVTQIEIFPFCIPAPAMNDISVSAFPSIFSVAANTGLFDPRTNINPVTGVTSQIPFCGRITLYLSELGRQSYIGFKGRRHHFEFITTFTGTPGEPDSRIILTPIKNIYTFTEPIQQIHGLTLNFYSPDNELRLPIDQIRGVTFSTNPAGNIQVTVPTTTGNSNIDLTTLLTSGERVYFGGVNFDTTITDNQVYSNHIGSENGLYVGTGITTNTFTFDPNITPISIPVSTAMPSSTSITMYIVKNRIRIPIRFRRIVDRLTNYIAP